MDDKKLVMTQKVLQDALRMVDKKLGKEEPKKKDNPADVIWKTLFIVLQVVLVLAAAAAVLEYFRNKKEEKAAVQEADQKELIRKMSAVKGRV